jgi:hypothetical protein
LGGFPWRCPYKAHDEGLRVTYRDSKDTFGPSTRTEAVFFCPRGRFHLRGCQIFSKLVPYEL